MTAANLKILGAKSKTCKKTERQGCWAGGSFWEALFIRKLTEQTEDSCTIACFEDQECNDFVLKTTGPNIGFCYLLRSGLIFIIRDYFESFKILQQIFETIAKFSTHPKEVTVELKTEQRRMILITTNARVVNF